MTNKVTLDQVEDLVKMLIGHDVEDVYLAHQPQLTRRQAFSVVYYLQEILCIIPDHYEMCGECDGIFDDRYGGGTRQGDNAQLCESCAQHYDFCNSSCCELVPFGTVDEDGKCEKCREESDGRHELDGETHEEFPE